MFMPLTMKKKAPLDKFIFFTSVSYFYRSLAKKNDENMVLNIQWYKHELRDNCSVKELYVRILFLVLCIEH